MKRRGKPSAAERHFIAEVSRKGTVRRPNLQHSQLRSATLAQLLYHGLATGEDDLALGVLYALRHDLDALASLAIAAEKGMVDVRSDIAETLVLLARRLDVGIELLGRRGK